MSDYLGSQRLLGYPSGQHQRPVAANVAQPTQLELTAQADWDETDLQVKSLIALRLSSNLRTHIGTMSEETWTSLDTTFSTPHFTGIFKDYELAHSIRLTMSENPEIWIQRLWTILERLRTNGCVISNYLQGMLLLKAIPREWDTVAQMYCNGMQMTNVTFSGVRDAIMAGFERTARPGQLAHQADKISAVKRKGPSPRFNEQRNQHSAPRPASDAPQGESSKKRTRKGGKREKARKACAARSIVSSAFVPVLVLNHMQASTSRVEEVVEQPAPTPITVVGGSSRAPVRSAAPVSITSHKPTGITYSKALTLPMQSTSGSSSSKAPFNMEKERKFLKEVGIRPTAEPICAMHKIIEEQGKELDVSLGKRHEFMTFAANSSPVQNAVASSSKTPEVPVEPLLQKILAHVPSFKSMKEFDEYEKKRCTRSKKAKKAKKESVHLFVELRGMETTNVQVFPEVGSEEPLDWGTPSAQDDESSYDSLSEELAATAGISHLLLTPAPSTKLSKGKGK